MEGSDNTEFIDSTNNVAEEYVDVKKENDDENNKAPSDNTVVQEEKIRETEENISQNSESALNSNITEVKKSEESSVEENNVSAVEEGTSKKLEEKPHTIFVIQEYGSKKDFTNGEQPLIRNSTIEELKLKLENKEILVRQRPNTPTSPLTPTTPTSPTRPDPSGEDSEDMIPETRAPSLLTDDGLIAPRKPVNPVREDPGRQNLHRELLFNQKIGKNVLNQKSELQRALERHKDNVAKKQLENHFSAKTPELEKVIADRARRLENPVKKEEGLHSFPPD